LVAALSPIMPEAGDVVARTALEDARAAIAALAEDLPDEAPDRLRSTWLARDDIAAVLAPHPPH
jgi:hypothetical protein